MQDAFNALSKATLIDICRACGIATGDTGRNSKLHYVEQLRNHGNQAQVEEAYATIVEVVKTTAVPALVVNTVRDVVSVDIVATKSAADLFGIRAAWAKGLQVDVWNDPDAPSIDPLYRFDQAHLRAFLTMMKAGRNVWLAGPKGTGKTDFVRQVCAYTGRAFIRVNYDASTEKYEIFGGERVKRGSTVWQDGAILIGMQRAGAVILHDEICRARPEYLIALNPLLEPNAVATIADTGETIRAAKGVMHVAADNTNGTGDPTGRYVAREMDSSTLDRFSLTLQFDYPEPDVEAGIVADRTGCQLDLAREVVTFLGVLRTSAVGGSISDVPSLRQGMAFAETIHLGIPVRYAFEAALSNKADPISREELTALYRAHINEDRYAAAAAGSLANYLAVEQAAHAAQQAAQAASVSEAPAVPV
jgi:nitric oxide reductase NorQ protein